MYAELKRKVCKQCKEEKDTTLFRFRKARSTYESYCKACESANNKVWMKKHKVSQAEKDFVRNLNKKFGLTKLEYFEILKQQNNHCAICPAEKSISGRRLAVDHDHATKMIRALLCNECNTALGLLKENIQIVLNLLAYLRKFKK